MLKEHHSQHPTELRLRLESNRRMPSKTLLMLPMLLVMIHKASAFTSEISPFHRPSSIQHGHDIRLILSDRTGRTSLHVLSSSSSFGISSSSSSSSWRTDRSDARGPSSYETYYGSTAARKLLLEQTADYVLDSVLLAPTMATKPTTATAKKSVAMAIDDVDDDDVEDINDTRRMTMKEQVTIMSPSQRRLVIELLSKLMTVNGQTLWTHSRRRSAAVPAGRTVLSTIVDPLGLFDKTVNANEEKAMEVAKHLLEMLASHQMQQQLQQQQEPHLVPSPMMPPIIRDLTQSEVSTFARMLSIRIWDRRIEFVRASNIFWKEMVTLTASRQLKAAVRKQQEDHWRVAASKKKVQRLLTSSSPPSLSSSSQQRKQQQQRPQETERLQAARNFLSYYQLDDSEQRDTGTVRSTL